MATSASPPFATLLSELSTLQNSLSSSYEKKEDEAVLNELLQECHLKIITLKFLSRNIFAMLEQQMGKVKQEKEVADVAHLQLQNLLYEKNLLLNEIKSCDNFKTPEYDKIELVSTATFGKNAPKALTKIKESNNPHEYLMNRLAYELMERKKLTQKRDEFIEQVKNEENIVNANIKKNEDLRSLFKDVIKTTLSYKHSVNNIA